MTIIPSVPSVELADDVLVKVKRLDPAKGFGVASMLAWQMRQVAAENAQRVIKGILPDVQFVEFDFENQMGDEGQTYRDCYFTTITMKDGRTLVVPDESVLQGGDFEYSSWVRTVEYERCREACENDPSLDLGTLLLAELGKPFALDDSQMSLLVETTSFLIRDDDGFRLNLAHDEPDAERKDAAPDALAEA